MFGADDVFVVRKRNRRRRVVAAPSDDALSTGWNECKSTTSTTPSSGIVAYLSPNCGDGDTLLSFSITTAPVLLVFGSLKVMVAVGFRDVR